MLALVATGTALVVACAMEAWAALLHSRAWHGPMWPIHRSHHERRRGRFEANDALSALHAPIAAGLVVWGCQPPHGIARAIAIGAGVGMTLFGAAYVVCHDGFVHRRLPVGWLARVPYFANVARAHRVHHALGGAPYGFFAAPLTMRRSKAHERPRARPAAPTDRGRAPVGLQARRHRRLDAAGRSREETG